MNPCGVYRELPSRVRQNLHGQRVAGPRSITINVNDPGSTAPLPLPAAPAGTGPNFAGDDEHAVIAGIEPHVARRRRVGYQTLLNDVLAQHIRKDVA